MADEEKDESWEETEARIEAEIAKCKESLFVTLPYPDPNWYLNARLHMGWDVYVDGYKRAADILVQHVADNNADQDLLVYPTLFCYRHYLELRLKWLIDIGSILLDKRDEAPTRHDLMQLWSMVRKIMDSIFPGGKSEYRDLIKARLEEFCQIDPKSEAFRYWTDKQHKATLQGVDIINLKRVKGVVQGIAHTLDGASIGIREYLETKREYKRDGY